MVVGAVVEVAEAEGLGAAILVAGAGALWAGAAGDCAAEDRVVVSGDVVGAVCCASALSVTSREAETIHFQVRILKSSLLSYPVYPKPVARLNMPAGKPHVRLLWNR